jgi:hypothetical protein
MRTPDPSAAAVAFAEFWLAVNIAPLTILRAMNPNPHGPVLFFFSILVFAQWFLLGGFMFFLVRRVARKLTTPSNTAPHADAREAPRPASEDDARAGGRKR